MTTPKERVEAKYRTACLDCLGSRLLPSQPGCQHRSVHLPDVQASHEHADNYGWACMICRGPCMMPNCLLPRCADPAPGLVGALCQLHEGHRTQHAFSIKWGEGWDSL